MSAIKLFVAVLALGLAGCGIMPTVGGGSSDVKWMKDGSGKDVCEYQGRILPKVECLKITDPTGERELAKKSEPGKVRTVLCFENIVGAMFGGFVDRNHNGRGSMNARVIDPGDGSANVSRGDCSPSVRRSTVYDKSDPYDEWGERQRRLERSYK